MYKILRMRLQVPGDVQTYCALRRLLIQRKKGKPFIKFCTFFTADLFVVFFVKGRGISQTK